MPPTRWTCLAPLLPRASRCPTSQPFARPEEKAGRFTDVPHGWRRLPRGLLRIRSRPRTVRPALQPLPAGRAAHAVVIKDGGDDPDATHGARITVTVIEGADAAEDPTEARQTAGSPDLPSPPIHIDGGPGVGRVTLPGLPCPWARRPSTPYPAGKWNGPLRHALQTRPGARRPLTVLVSVPQGAALAEHTFNSRLGIVGGISILGTQGTVRPFSHAAWKATIAQGLEVVRATAAPPWG